MFVISPSGSAANVTLRSSTVALALKPFSGNTIDNPLGGVFATVIIVSFVLKFPAVSLTLAVKLITLPLVTFIVTFWENWAEVPVKEKLKNLLKPLMFTMTWPKLRFCMSVALADILMMSFTVMFVNDLFKVEFIIGKVVSIVKLIERLACMSTPSLMLTLSM